MAHGCERRVDMWRRACSQQKLVTEMGLDPALASAAMIEAKNRSRRSKSVHSAESTCKNGKQHTPLQIHSIPEQARPRPSDHNVLTGTSLAPDHRAPIKSFADLCADDRAWKYVEKRPLADIITVSASSETENTAVNFLQQFLQRNSQADHTNTVHVTLSKTGVFGVELSPIHRDSIPAPNLLPKYSNTTSSTPKNEITNSKTSAVTLSLIHI